MSALHQKSWGELHRLMQLMSRFLTPVHKRQLIFVSFWACGVSLLEMLVAASVIPYVQCLSGQCLASIQSTLKGQGWSVIPTLSLGLFVLIALKLTIQARFHWSSAHFNQQVQADTVSRLLNGYLHLDWRNFRSQHQAHYIRRCAITAVDAAYVSQQCVTMISSLLLIMFLIALMISQYPLASLGLGAGFLLVNSVIQHLVGKAQKITAHQREAALQHWNIGMAEAFSSFRELRVYGLERFFLAHLNRATDDLAVANRKLSFLPVLPRLVLDFIIFGTVLLVVSAWLLMQRPLVDLIPQLVFYAVVARVVLPAMMHLMSTRSVLYGSIVNIELVLKELHHAAEGQVARVGIEPTAAESPAYILDKVSFSHAPDWPPVLVDVDLNITHPSWVAIVGQSGAGKSTLMELMSGIQRPLRGQVIHRWPNVSGEPAAPRVAYLPQQVALLAGSVMDNVVFGFDEGDVSRVHEALHLARLEAVVAKLPDGINTLIGADGGRLSGGERQRLALARALYRNPDLLLLDEATSGLDEDTESRLLAALRIGRPKMTVLYITHRSSNLCFADSVIYLQDSKLQIKARSVVE